MIEKSTLERLLDVFKEATLEEFYGDHLFESLERDYYQFSSNETGPSMVLLIEGDSKNPYKTFKAEGGKSLQSRPIVPRLYSFTHCEPIDEDSLEYGRIKEIESRLKKGGRILAQKANKALIDVLSDSISEANRIKAQPGQLDEILTDAFSSLVKSGFQPSRFIFPNYLKAKLVQQRLIVPDNEIRNPHYVGKTPTGELAFSSGELTADTVIVFDSSATVMLTKKPKFYLNQLGPFLPGTCGLLYLNPVVKDTKAVVALENIEQALNRKNTREVSRRQLSEEVTYINPERINELRAISSPNFDLLKLIKLCEELNICYANDCSLAVAMLTRAILDHIPPIFGQPNFKQVASNYGGQSLKKSIQNLDNSSRNIADRHLHSPIRKKEAVPNRTQVNFSNDLDVLLEEIVSILK